ncbi:MAG: bacillithiol system redox-active protein YtxJ [Bacteroidota bacterium]
MNVWEPLQDEAKIAAIQEASFQRPQLIFKHSVTCGISAHVQHMLGEAAAKMAEQADLHYLDLLRYRAVSNAVASTLGVVHQSPQVIILKNGEVAYADSHFAIQPAKILSMLSAPVG